MTPSEAAVVADLITYVGADATESKVAIISSQSQPQTGADTGA